MNTPNDAQEGGRPLNMSEASAAAMADIEALNKLPETAEAEPAAAAPVAEEPPPVEEPAAADAEPQLAEKFEITYKGETRVLTKDEVRELAQKGYDYTQKSQQVAAERRALEAERQQRQAEMQRLQALEQERQQVQRFFQDPRVRTALAQLQQQTQAPAAAPDDVVTVEHLQQALRAQAAEAQRRIEEAEQKATAQQANSLFQLEVARHQSAMQDAVQREVATQLAKHELIADIDGIEDLLLADGHKAFQARVADDPLWQPSPAELAQFVREAAERRQAKEEAKLAKKLENHTKMAAVRQHKLTKQGAEPAGGAAPPVPAKPAASFKLGDPRLTASVVEELQAAFNAKN